jgi:hypothetical protein
MMMMVMVVLLFVVIITAVFIQGPTPGPRLHLRQVKKSS